MNTIEGTRTRCQNCNFPATHLIDGINYCVECRDKYSSSCQGCGAGLSYIKLLQVGDGYYCYSCIKARIDTVVVLKRDLDKIYNIVNLNAPVSNKIDTLNLSLRNMYSYYDLSLPLSTFKVDATWVEDRSGTEFIKASSREEAIEKFREKFKDRSRLRFEVVGG